MTPARSGCSCRHTPGRTHRPGTPSTPSHTGWGVPVHCFPPSEVCLIHPAQETMTNTLQQPPHICTKHRHKCRQHLPAGSNVTIFPHLSTLKKKKVPNFRQPAAWAHLHTDQLLCVGILLSFLPLPEPCTAGIGETAYTHACLRLRSRF